MSSPLPSSLFFFNATPLPHIYTLSLHDALPISQHQQQHVLPRGAEGHVDANLFSPLAHQESHHTIHTEDRKSTRLNSSHLGISYAVFCLKKKKKNNERLHIVTKRTNTREEERTL